MSKDPVARNILMNEVPEALREIRYCLAVIRDKIASADSDHLGDAIHDLGDYIKKIEQKADADE